MRGKSSCLPHRTRGAFGCTSHAGSWRSMIVHLSWKSRRASKNAHDITGNILNRSPARDRRDCRNCHSRDDCRCGLSQACAGHWRARGGPVGAASPSADRARPRRGSRSRAPVRPQHRWVIYRCAIIGALCLEGEARQHLTATAGVSIGPPGQSGGERAGAVVPQRSWQAGNENAPPVRM
jgi:hypothetical protein